MLPFLALSPFLLIPAAAWLGKQRARWSSLLAIWPAALALYFGYLLLSVSATQPIEVSLPWAESLALTLSFLADGLSLVFAILITGIGSLIVVFSSRYFDGDPRSGKFQATLFAFMGSMLGVVLSNNLLVLFVFWELTGFTSFLLIGFDSEKAAARASAIQAFVVTGTGGMGLLAAAVLIQQTTGTVHLCSLLSGRAMLHNLPEYPFIAVLLLFAAFTKSAQAPFHFWLPNAMTAPTPVSAYLHSATMVKAGLYLVARMTPLLAGTLLWTGIVTAVGAITMTLGAWRAVAETDLKRVLAYSTISALGVIMLLLGLGTTGAVTAALVYLIAHACYKGALFLIAGTLEHETGTRDITDLGGLRRSVPATALAGALAACSMAGIPFFLGFTAKELLYDSLLGADAWKIAVLAAAVGASALLGAAGLTAGVSPFVGLPGKAEVTHAVPLALASPPLILATLGLAAGLWPGSINLPVDLAAKAVLHAASGVHLELWHGFTPVLALSLVTLVLAGALYYGRDAVRRSIWPRSLGFEKLYTWTLHVLDTTSARSLHALQGASLRAYVLALIVTAGTLIAAVQLSGELPGWPGTGDVQPHEAAAALMTIAGALSAARAKSTMTAVLSLGVSGYGMALTFLFFGAPDLAMTQFSVETLTAVIFVLVFYHFRGFGELSPMGVRVRDTIVSVLFGASIAAVLFFIGAFVTPAKLAGYFAQQGFPLAHGRNIVNVILVDFRALDTLGEITVLATAALGVRAVLRLGRGEKHS
jgi:multicomponent Na+:H+ antiporter subunit A